MWKTATYIGEKFVCRSAKKIFTGAICDCLLCVGTALKQRERKRNNEGKIKKEKRKKKIREENGDISRCQKFL